MKAWARGDRRALRATNPSPGHRSNLQPRDVDVRVVLTDGSSRRAGASGPGSRTTWVPSLYACDMGKLSRHVSLFSMLSVDFQVQPHIVALKYAKDRRVRLDDVDADWRRCCDGQIRTERRPHRLRRCPPGVRRPAPRRAPTSGPRPMRSASWGQGHRRRAGAARWDSSLCEAINEEGGRLPSRLDDLQATVRIARGCRSPGDRRRDGRPSA